jgi:hypothetical protein
MSTAGPGEPDQPGTHGAHARSADTARTEVSPPRTTDADHTDTDTDSTDRALSSGGPGRREVVAQQKEQFGGIKWGSAFFGWLTATGTALLLTALVAAAGTGIGLATADTGAGEAVDQATRAAQDPATAATVGLGGAIVLLVILFLAYVCGGYVAGRMARFNGIKQGIAVWVWAIVIAIVIAVLGALAGNQFDVLANLNGLPRLPINEGTLTTAGIIAALLALAAALAGAILGGLAGMRYHRKVDRAGFHH